MNTVFGRFFDVLPVEAADPAALRERTGESYFIFDVQVHYVGSGYDPGNAEAGRKGAVTKQGLLGLRKGAQRMNPQLAADRGTMADLAWQNFVKEVFLDSEREQGDAGDYAAAGISSASMSMSGYQRLKMAPNSPSSVFTRVCSNKCAPGLDHCICCFLQKRLLTT
jgi:hypothetical protein